MNKENNNLNNNLKSNRIGKNIGNINIEPINTNNGNYIYKS